MLYQTFRQVEDLLGGCETFKCAYATYLQSGNVPSSLADDIHQLEKALSNDQQAEDEEVCVMSFL